MKKLLLLLLLISLSLYMSCAQTTPEETNPPLPETTYTSYPVIVVDVFQAEKVRHSFVVVQFEDGSYRKIKRDLWYGTVQTSEFMLLLSCHVNQQVILTYREVWVEGDKTQVRRTFLDTVVKDYR